MHNCLMVLIFFGVIPWCHASDPEDPFAPKHPRLQRIKSIRLVCKKIHLANAKQLRQFTKASNDEIYVHACWERTLRSFPRQKNGLRRMSKTTLSRFLGQVEGRLRIEFPDNWRTEVVRGNEILLDSQVRPVKCRSTGFYRFPSLRLTTKRNRLVVDDTKHKVRIPRKYLVCLG